MVPDGFLQKVTSLEELEIGVGMLSFESKMQFFKDLGNLRQLRVLRVLGMGRLDESMQAELLKSLGNLQFQFMIIHICYTACAVCILRLPFNLKMFLSHYVSMMQLWYN